MFTEAQSRAVSAGCVICCRAVFLELVCDGESLGFGRSVRIHYNPRLVIVLQLLQGWSLWPSCEQTGKSHVKRSIGP